MPFTGSHTSVSNLNDMRGFSLIELLITVAIIAILSTVAYPSLQSYVLKSHRPDAMDCIQDMALRLERFYAENATYTDDESLLGYAGNGPQLSNERYYTCAVTNAAATTYVVTATPRQGQTADTIQSFILNSDGSKQYTDTDGINTGWDD